MFPTGVVGVGLLVLRLSIITGLLTQSATCCNAIDLGWLRLALIMAAVCLCAGFLTPYICFICWLIEIANRWQVTDTSRSHAWPLLLASVALAMLGPGAYSVDARLFGRRRLVFVSGRNRVERGHLGDGNEPGH